MPSSVIAVPTRDQLEELFQTAQRMNLDERCRGDLRVLAASRRLAREVMSTSENVRTDIAQSHPFHLNTIQREYYQGDGADGKATEAGMSSFLAKRLASGGTDDIDFYLRSVSVMGLSPYVAATADKGAYHDLSAAHMTLIGSYTMLADIAVCRHILRRYPHIRFNPARYIRLKTHWDEIDHEGVPRVSLDGYEI